MCRIELSQETAKARSYHASVIDWRTIMVIMWLFDFAEFVRFVREGALIAQRKRPDELKRYLAS
jgi:hypothetical protein